MYFQTSCNDFLTAMEYFNLYHAVVDAAQSLCVCRVVCARSREREKERIARERECVDVLMYVG